MKKALVIGHSGLYAEDFLQNELKERGYEINHILNAREEEVPSTIDGYDFLAILGAKESVYERHDYPFIEKEILLAKDALAKNIHSIGICFGAQVFTVAAGGESVECHKGHSFGYRNLTFVESDPVIGDELEGVKIFQFHKDTFRHPEIKSVAHGDRFQNQILRLSSHCYVTQFHFETTKHSIEERYNMFVSADYKGEPDFSLEEALQQADVYIPRTKKWLKAFLDRFLVE